MSADLYEKGFTVMGIEARTNNAAEMGPNGIILKQWEKFMTENLMAQIPNKADQSIIAGYTEYQSDFKGDYTFFLGMRVNSVGELPQGMVVKHVQPGKYKVLTSKQGQRGEVVVEVWKNIWSNYEPLRTYRFDFELYDVRSQNPNKSIVDIYLGVK